MEKPTRVTVLSPKRRRNYQLAHSTVLRPDWADAEARAFLERPHYRPTSTSVLRVILVTAMIVAAIKIAWIVAIHA